MEKNRATSQLCCQGFEQGCEVETCPARPRPDAVDAFSVLSFHDRDGDRLDIDESMDHEGTAFICTTRQGVLVTAENAPAIAAAILRGAGLDPATTILAQRTPSSNESTESDRPMERNQLTPYDTGEVLEPAIWGGEHGPSLPHLMDRDEYGKVDFDNDGGETVVTVWVQRNCETGAYEVMVRDFSAEGVTILREED